MDCFVVIQLVTLWYHFAAGLILINYTTSILVAVSRCIFLLETNLILEQGRVFKGPRPF